MEAIIYYLVLTDYYATDFKGILYSHVALSPKIGNEQTQDGKSICLDDNDGIEFMRGGYEGYAASQEEGYSMIQAEHDSYKTNANIDDFVLVSDGMYTIDAGVSGLFRPSNSGPFTRRLQWLANCTYEPNHMGV